MSVECSILYLQYGRIYDTALISAVSKLIGLIYSSAPHDDAVIADIGGNVMFGV